jgi:hypothetical protein
MLCPASLTYKSIFQRYLLFMAPDNTLQDCDGVAEGSAIDSEIIQVSMLQNFVLLQH